MKVLLVGNGGTVLELMRHFIMKWNHEVVVAEGGGNIVKEVESLNEYDVVVMSTLFVVKYFRNGQKFVCPSVVCSIESSIKTPVEEAGGIFVDKCSRNFIDDLCAALDKIAKERV